MASLTNEAKGRMSVQFVAADGKRKTIRLGKVSPADAERWRARIERLVWFVGCGESADPKLLKWLAGLNDTLHGRIAAVGLAAPRNHRSRTIVGFIADYIDSHPELKSRTIVKMEQLRSWLVKCCGESFDIRKVGVAQAETFAAFMRKSGLSENTVRRHTGRARQLWKVAIRRGIYHGQNPFDGMAVTVRSDKARQFFVSREKAERVLAACPDAEWRLMFALSRYGGLRCPSEHLALKWEHISWGDADTLPTILIPSPKTAHHDGKESRRIPIFPELLPYLREVWEQAKAGTEYVITRYRSGAVNVRTQLTRIIRKAGLEPWPKLWHNLRATRQTELAATEPLHVVCAWLGNSRVVAQEFYLQVTAEDFRRGAGMVAEKAVQNPVQQEPVVACTDSHQSLKARENQGCASPCEVVQGDQWALQGSNL